MTKYMNTNTKYMNTIYANIKQKQLMTNTKYMSQHANIKQKQLMHEHNLCKTKTKAADDKY